VLAALFAASFGAAVPAAGAATNPIKCNTNIFLELFPGLKSPTEDYCFKATICTGKKERPEPMNNAIGKLDTAISTLLNPPILDKDNNMEKALAGCQASCSCTNYNPAG
jgi:hypothetical protein